MRIPISMRVILSKPLAARRSFGERSESDSSRNRGAVATMGSVIGFRDSAIQKVTFLSQGSGMRFEIPHRLRLARLLARASHSPPKRSTRHTWLAQDDTQGECGVLCFLFRRQQATALRGRKSLLPSRPKNKKGAGWELGPNLPGRCSRRKISTHMPIHKML